MLDGPADLYSLYDLSSPYSDGCFPDITSGSNGNPAGTGYDMATGIGSPIADELVPTLGFRAGSPVPEPGTLRCWPPPGWPGGGLRSSAAAGHRSVSGATAVSAVQTAPTALYQG